MDKERKRRHKRTKHCFISYYVYEKEPVEFVREGMRIKRWYTVSMHRNNNTGIYCAYYGFRREGRMKIMWMKTASQIGFTQLKDELLHRYHNHVEILLGQMELVKVEESITDAGNVPGTRKGNALPLREGYTIFKVIWRKKKDFGLLIEGKDGKRYRVDESCFVRAWPKNWIEDAYLED